MANSKETVNMWSVCLPGHRDEAHCPEELKRTILRCLDQNFCIKPTIGCYRKCFQMRYFESWILHFYLPIERMPLTCLTVLNSPTTVFTATSRCSSFNGANLPLKTSATCATKPLSTCGSLSH